MEFAKPIIFWLFIIFGYCYKQSKNVSLNKQPYDESKYDWKKNYYSGKEPLPPSDSGYVELERKYKRHEKNNN